MLLFALVLGLTALAASVSPTRDQSGTVVTPAVGPRAPAPKAIFRTISFAMRPGHKPLTRTARTGEHLVLSVASAQGGLVTIPRLGRTASVDPSAPAAFDLLAPDAGRYDVLFSASGVDEPQRVGTLVTHR